MFTPPFVSKVCGEEGKARATILFMGLHRSEQIPPRRNKNVNWIYWVQGVCLNETLASFVFWFGRMMHRFLHENPLYTFCSLGSYCPYRCLLQVKYLKSNKPIKIYTCMLWDMFINTTWITRVFDSAIIFYNSQHDVGFHVKVVKFACLYLNKGCRKLGHVQNL